MGRGKECGEGEKRCIECESVKERENKRERRTHMQRKTRERRKEQVAAAQLRTVAHVPHAVGGQRTGCWLQWTQNNLMHTLVSTPYCSMQWKGVHGQHKHVRGVGEAAVP